MFYITGDTHGDFERLEVFAALNHLKQEKDTIIILGDVGINYYVNSHGKGKDYLMKKFLSYSDYSLLCIKGNHEQYPAKLKNYKTKEWHGGRVYYEEEFPSILFAKDGEIYDINGQKCLVIGGAYSVDKFYRLAKGWSWFLDEQPDEKTKRFVEKQLKAHNWEVDIVLSHTCPFNTIPTHMFMKGVDQSKVDNSTEIWLQEIADKLEFKKWYFGHYHGNWTNENYEMLYEKIKPFK